MVKLRYDDRVAIVTRVSGNGGRRLRTSGRDICKPVGASTLEPVQAVFTKRLRRSFEMATQRG